MEEIKSMPNFLVYVAESLAYSCFLEGFHVTRCSFDRVSEIDFNNFDIALVAVAPSTVEIIDQLEVPIIGIESDPDGGISCSSHVSGLLRAYSRCQHILPLNESTELIFPDKISDIPLGLYVEPLEKYLDTPKQLEPTAVLCHYFRSGNGFVETLKFLSNHNYRIMATYASDFIETKEELDLVINSDKLILKSRVHLSKHNRWIASSHLLCQLSNLSCAGSAVAKAAYFGIPSIVSDHYYQRFLFPNMVVRSLSDAERFIQDTDLQAESIKLAKERLNNISILNKTYRKRVKNLVIKTYEEN